MNFDYKNAFGEIIKLIKKDGCIFFFFHFISFWFIIRLMCIFIGFLGVCLSAIIKIMF